MESTANSLKPILSNATDLNMCLIMSSLGNDLFNKLCTNTSVSLASNKCENICSFASQNLLNDAFKGRGNKKDRVREEDKAKTRGKVTHTHTQNM